MMENEFKVEPNGRGQFTATVNGKFFGNYDTIQEAVRDYEENYDPEIAAVYQ